MAIIELTKILGGIFSRHTLDWVDSTVTGSKAIHSVMLGDTSFAYDLAPSYAKRVIDTIAADLEAYNFEAIGSGHFSIVLTHPATPKVVYKVSLRPDDAYSHYALWCRANPNPHAPTMLRIERHGNYHVFAMPLYKEHPNKLTYQMYMQQWLDGPHDATSQAKANVPRSLRLFLVAMAAYFDHVCPLDLHEENFMVCPDTGNVIITDPVSYNDRINDNVEQYKRHELEETFLDEAA